MQIILLALACLTVVAVGGCESRHNIPVQSSAAPGACPTSDNVPPIVPMDADPEAKALLAKLQAMKIAPTAPRDDFNSPGARQLSGPVTIRDGIALFPEERSNAMYIQYGVVLPKRGRLSLDFRVDRLPLDHTFMTLCDTGTGGNMKFAIRLGMDRRVTVEVLTRRTTIRMLSEPVALGQWHRLRWWYAPEGAVLETDGAIQDYSTDDSVPYAVGVGDAFYLGDQPWWNGEMRRPDFYPLDNFVGCIDNLALDALQP